MIITNTTQLTTIECGGCSILFAMPTSKYNRCLETGEAFFCPNGHSRHFTTSENSKLKSQLEEKKRELVAQKCETLKHQQLLEAEQTAKAKLERRIKHGTCPCCKRTFERLANHIAKAHPDFGPKQKRNLP